MNRSHFLVLVLVMVLGVLIPTSVRSEVLELVERADRLREELLERLCFEDLAPGTVVGHGNGEVLQAGRSRGQGQYRLRGGASLRSFLRGCEDYGRIMAPLLGELRNELREGNLGLRLDDFVSEVGTVSDGCWSRPGRIARIRVIDSEPLHLSRGDALRLLERLGTLLSFHNTLCRGLLVDMTLWDRLRLLVEENRWAHLRVVEVPYSGPGFSGEAFCLASSAH